MDVGSRWRRWEPHIHGPDTIMNNQYGGPNKWDDYLTALEKASPIIEAVAVTDYYVTDTYERVLAEKVAGRLPQVQLIFPNVELRLDVATSKGSFVNIHLFVSPEDSDHIDQLHRLLSRLHFTAFDDQFDCTRTDLIRLGKRADSTITDEQAALRHGANQYKVNFRTLVNVINNSEWAKRNILVAVAGSATDGTSGVREAADKTIREEIEKFAHVIFASSSAQRDFWLGHRSTSANQLEDRYNGLKPCLHGSDAHKLEDVGLPFGDRFSWIKGGLEFDALRQACIDPANRAFVGTEPPQAASPSQTIREVTISNAPWLKNTAIPLNAGLIAIIGARGSGKTALAEIIAAGCDAISYESWEKNGETTPSFLARAYDLLDDGKVELKWGSDTDGDIVSLREPYPVDASSYARARYLSQQFVEDLCSASGLSDGLLKEIDRVIFEAHPINDRDGAVSFDELRALRVNRFMAIPEDVELAKIPLATLEAEMERIERLINVDKRTQQQYSALTTKISLENATLASLTQRLDDCKGAKARAVQLFTEREAAYGRIFDAILAEQKALEDLYTPLMKKLESASGTLSKLSFSVSRIADCKQWADVAEDTLLDLRKGDALKGVGSLEECAKAILLHAWETGSAKEVTDAMTKFRDLYQEELLSHAPVMRTDIAEFRAWSKTFAHWLFGTNHIRIEYGIEYGGVDIRKLSPGTRGIVLLLLYLALDNSDDRPLIIDQPEENLDPKSVFDELVPLFIQAKARRQVIIVTHNANLVINTDADQIIIAEAELQVSGALPVITYTSGGLDSAPIRKIVCDILEGGEKAFKERARRLRVRLDR